MTLMQQGAKRAGDDRGENRPAGEYRGFHQDAGRIDAFEGRTKESDGTPPG